MATEYQYIIDSTSLKEEYDRLKSIIKALQLQQVSASANSDVVSYTLDDGQTKITTTYRSPEQIKKAILGYKQLLNDVIQEMTGTRIVRLADAGSIQSNGFVQ